VDDLCLVLVEGKTPGASHAPAGPCLLACPPYGKKRKKKKKKKRKKRKRKKKKKNKKKRKKIKKKKRKKENKRQDHLVPPPPGVPGTLRGIRCRFEYRHRRLPPPQEGDLINRGG